MKKVRVHLVVNSKPRVKVSHASGPLDYYEHDTDFKSELLTKRDVMTKNTLFTRMYKDSEHAKPFEDYYVVNPDESYTLVAYVENGDKDSARGRCKQIAKDVTG